MTHCVERREREEEKRIEWGKGGWVNQGINRIKCILEKERKKERKKEKRGMEIERKKERKKERGKEGKKEREKWRMKDRKTGSVIERKK